MTPVESTRAASEEVAQMLRSESSFSEKAKPLARRFERVLVAVADEASRNSDLLQRR